MRKKLICLILIVIILLINFKFSFADDIDEEVFELDTIDVINQIEDEPKVNSKIAIAYDRISGSVIWGKNENKKTPMASTTKIMTAIVAIENGNLADIVEVSRKAANTGGSRLKIKTNDKISLNDLLYGLMLVSGNDSAVAIAEHVGGNVEGFAVLMNNKANELGLENTHFVTPHGLDNPEHYTTAYELAKLADYALKNDTFKKIVGTKNHTITINGRPRMLTNTNELLGFLNGVNGVKTGFTNNAGRCLVTSVNRDGFEIITVIIQADTKKMRTADSINLIEYVYKNYELVNIKQIVDEKFKCWCNINKNRIRINKSRKDDLELYISALENDVIPIKKLDKDKIEIDISNVYYLESPVYENTMIGTAKVTCKKDVIDVLEIRNENTIERRNVLDYIRIFAMEFCK